MDAIKVHTAGKIMVRGIEQNGSDAGSSVFIEKTGHFAAQQIEHSYGNMRRHRHRKPNGCR